VHHATLVCVIERLGDLLRHRQRFIERHRPLRDALRQRRPLHQLHHQGAVFHSINRSDVRMIERRQHLRFAREPRHAVGIGGEGLRQHLDGDVAPELGIGSTPDLAHAARPELRKDAVVGDGLLRAHVSDDSITSGNDSCELGAY
jgi:hypothetical protein